MTYKPSPCLDVTVEDSGQLQSTGLFREAEVLPDQAGVWDADTEIDVRQGAALGWILGREADLGHCYGERSSRAKTEGSGLLMS